MTQQGIKLTNVQKSFGAVPIIKGIDIEIPKGDFAVFVGPSGCGKSTLLRMIAGLESTSAGQIEIAGRDVTHLEPSERGIAMVFQSYALYPHLSVYQNMAFSLKLSKRPRSEIDQKVREAADILRLTDHLDKRPSQLSGGQRQRVAIGRAIVRAPDVFLFDEPLSNLDAELRVQMRLELGRLHQKLGTTMIYVTHDQVEAMTMADRIFVLRDGLVQQSGKPLDLYDDPQNRFVAGFIGSPSMNFLNGTVSRCAPGEIQVRLDGDVEGDLLQVRTSGDIPAGKAVTIGVRPEHLRLASADEAGVAVKIDIEEDLGGTSFLYGHTASKAPVVYERRGGREAQRGRTLRLTADPTQVVAFREDGTRLR